MLADLLRLLEDFKNRPWLELGGQVPPICIGHKPVRQIFKSCVWDFLGEVSAVFAAALELLHCK